MYRDQQQDDRNLSRVGILFCCGIWCAVFVCGLVVLPVRSTLPAALEHLSNPMASRPLITEQFAPPSAPPSVGPAATPVPSTAPAPAPSQPPASVAPPPAAAATPAAKPAPSAPPSPTPAAESKTYVVEAGDTLYRIASRFDTSVQAIAELNGVANPATVKVGQRLAIP